MEEKKQYRLALIKAVFMVVAIFALVVAIGVGVRYMLNNKHAAQISKMEKNILEMQSTLSVDSIRQYNIKKIISIVDEYNVTMPVHQKYEIAEEIIRMTTKYDNLNVDLICATITHESAGTWNPEIQSPAGAKGLMQIMPATGMFVAAYEDINWLSANEVLFNPIYNIRIGSRYLSSLIENYDVDGGLAAYNGGERRAALWIGSGKAAGILPKETQEYVPAIQRLYEEYKDFRM
jgi:membrane-bound lytic murein transglycosylase MltF